MSQGVAHIVGAGLAGLSAAVDLAKRGVTVELYEAAPQAGGRCRSYFDPTLGMEIDNGNHLILSGNHATLAYLDAIGGRGGLTESASASFPFVDLATQERWTVRANEGPVPWWIFVPSRRVPGVPVSDYFELAKLLRPKAGASIGQTLRCAGPLYQRLLEPFLMSALNVEPKEGSAALAGSVIRETLAAGGRQYHPLTASDGLSKSFVDPALAFLARAGGRVHLGQRLRGLELREGQVAQLEFADTTVALSPDDRVIVATPPHVASAWLPGLTAPDRFCAIVNAHYRVGAPDGLAPIIGVVNGLAQWLFAFPGRLSVTISAADALLDEPREALAARIWRDVAEIAGLAGPMPTWQIVRERRATFAATPEQDARRPPSQTAWRNLHLAGDWTQTGLPATIEGAIRSGVKAARLSVPLGSGEP